MIWIAKFTFLLLCMFFSMCFGLNLKEKDRSNVVLLTYIFFVLATGIIAVVLK